MSSNGAFKTLHSNKTRFYFSYAQKYENKEVAHSMHVTIQYIYFHLHLNHFSSEMSPGPFYHRRAFEFHLHKQPKSDSQRPPLGSASFLSECFFMVRDTRTKSMTTGT